MTRYPYHPKLPKPGNWSSIDFANPKLAPAVRMLVQGIHKEVAAMKPLPGTSIHKETVSAWDGPELPCYVLEPQDAPEVLPAMLYCHGGGFFLPIQPMMMKLAAQYARALQIRVFLPEYRILPEYSNPYPFQDCLSVWQMMEKDCRIDIDHLLLYGESAGGALATGLALWARDHGGAVAKGQLLIYPVLDNRCSPYPSVRQYSEAAWPLKNNLAMWRAYLKSGKDDISEYIIPMSAKEVSDLPKAYIEPQEIDILKDEAYAYGQRLAQAGVPVIINEISGSYHGFDAAVENEYVQIAVQKRIEVMKQYLA